MKTAALVVIVKDEVRYLREWVSYHKSIGFSQILVYDNASRDGTAELCSQLVRSEGIQHIYWPDSEGVIDVQKPAYKDAVQRIETDWVAFIDADEFIILEHDRSVLDWLVRIGAQVPIALNWKIYGSSKRLSYTEELMLERFTYRAPRDFKANRHIKTIGPTDYLRKHAIVDIHGWVSSSQKPLAYINAAGSQTLVDGHTFSEVCWEQAWINHYIVKSLQEFEWKSEKGSATAKNVSRPKRKANYFDIYDRNEVHDPLRPSIVERTKLYMISTV